MCLKSDLETSATNFLDSNNRYLLYLLIRTYILIHYFLIPIVFIINYYLVAINYR